MRFYLVTSCLFIISPAAFAASDYNDPSHYKQRAIPRNQFNNGNANAGSNGHIIKENPKRYNSNNDYDLNVGIEGGYRTSQLKWSIGIDGIIPYTISNLEWENNNGYEIQPSVEYTQKTGSLKGLNLQASVNKSITTSGENQDSDYDLTGEISRSNNSSDAGHSEGFSASIGYAFNFTGKRKQDVRRFTALVGYAMQNQKFVLRDGYQTIPATGPIAGLRSSYDVELSMPFVGADYYTQFGDVHSLKISGKVSKASYNGTGHWNLRSDLAHPDSFAHDADGWAFLLGAKYGWNFYPNLKLTLAANLNYFKATDGDDTVYTSSGTVLNAALRKVRYASTDYLAGLNYSF